MQSLATRRVRLLASKTGATGNINADDFDPKLHAEIGAVVASPVVEPAPLPDVAVESEPIAQPKRGRR